MRRVFVAVAFGVVAGCSGPAPQPVTETAPPASVEAEAPAPAPSTGPVVAARCVPAADRLCPQDDGASDSSFAAFRRQLSDAVGRRDDAALMALLDPQVRVSFGEGGGRDAFRKAWKLPSAESPLWGELEQILGAGGSFRGEGAQRMFWAPYVYANWPDEVDAFEHVAALSGEAAIFADRDRSSTRVAAAPWSILRVVPRPDDKPGAEWRRVRTRRNEEGWIPAGDIRSPVGYRAGFSKRSGEWRLEALVSGD